MSTAPVALDAWDGRSLAEWRALWHVPELHLFARVDSTSDVLRARAAADAPAFAVAIAEEQTAGRGQYGRHWVAPPGTSLLLSVLLRPSACDALAAVPLRVGLAAAHAVHAATGLDPGIKWPNDLVMQGRKLGGILCEAVTTGTRTTIVAGIGINCLQQERDFPPDIASLATSLRIAGGVMVERGVLTGAILQALVAIDHRIAGPLTESEIAAFAARDTLRDRPITIDGEAAGIAAGITPAGALRVRTPAGTRTVHHGTVRIASARDVAHERAQ